MLAVYLIAVRTPYVKPDIILQNVFAYLVLLEIPELHVINLDYPPSQYCQLDATTMKSVHYSMHVKTPNVSILVPKGTLVPPAQSAKLSTTNQNVHAPMDTLDPPLQTVDHHQNLNARPILNALITLHVYKKSVKIHVILILVVEMQNARQKIIEQYVFVSMDMLEIRTLSVKNLDVKVTMNAHLHKLASIENVKIHAHLNDVASTLSVA